MTLSEHVKSLRKHENLTQQELADRAGPDIHHLRITASEGVRRFAEQLGGE